MWPFYDNKAVVETSPQRDMMDKPHTMLARVKAHQEILHVVLSGLVSGRTRHAARHRNVVSNV